MSLLPVFRDLLQGGLRLLVRVELRQNESQQQLLKRFRKRVARSGILSAAKRKRWFVPDSQVRRIKKKKAIQRHKRRQRKRQKRY